MSHGPEPADRARDQGRLPTNGRGQTSVIVQSGTYAFAPLPSAAGLLALREVMPNGPERVFALAERSSEDLRNLQELAIRAEADELRSSRLAAIAVPLAGLGAGLAIAATGEVFAGAGVCGAALLPNLIATLLGARAERGSTPPPSREG